MSDQTTLMRTLELMVILCKPGGASLEYLAERFMVHKRTIQRTIESIKMVGFHVHKQKGRYRIIKEVSSVKEKYDIREILTFKTTDTNADQEGIGRVDDPGQRKLRNLLELIQKRSEEMGPEIERVDTLIEQNIMQAIRDKKQLILETYLWSKRNEKLVELVIEPVEYDEKFKRVWAWVPKYGKNMLIRVGYRVVRLSDKPFMYIENHRKGITDVFLNWGVGAFQALMEFNGQVSDFIEKEYPAAMQQIRSIDTDKYLFSGDICDFRPVARILMKFPNDLKIKGGPELLNYLDKIKNRAPWLFTENRNYRADDIEIIVD